MRTSLRRSRRRNLASGGGVVLTEEVECADCSGQMPDDGGSIGVVGAGCRACRR